MVETQNSTESINKLRKILEMNAKKHPRYPRQKRRNGHRTGKGYIKIPTKHALSGGNRNTRNRVY